MFNIHLTANLLRNLSVKNFDRIMVMSMWPRFWSTLYIYIFFKLHVNKIELHRFNDNAVHQVVKIYTELLDFSSHVLAVTKGFAQAQIR